MLTFVKQGDIDRVWILMRITKRADIILIRINYAFPQEGRNNLFIIQILTYGTT